MKGWKETTLDITADDRVWTPIGVGALNIGAVQCISELVANSIDWRRLSETEKSQRLEERGEDRAERDQFDEKYEHLLATAAVSPLVRVRVDRDAIEVLDNGVGMTLKELEVGLKLRAADDTKRVPLRTRKGMFGMGLKVGVLGLGWKVTIRTRSLFEREAEHLISINTRQIESGTLKLREIKAFTGLHDSESPLGEWDSGTSILVEDLHKHGHDPVTFRERLGRAFGPEIEYQGMTIVVEDHTQSPPQIMDPCEPEVITVIPETKISLDDENLFVAPDRGDGTRGEPMKIRGWLALRVRSGSGTGLWGVHTFRYNQLVEAFHNDGPRADGLLPKNPHPEHARLHGEIHLDMCDPNFTKVGWNTELLSWHEAREELGPLLARMQDASRAYRRKTGGAKAIQMLQGAKRTAEETLTHITGDIETSDGGVEEEESLDIIRLEDGTRLKISVATAGFTKAIETEQFWRYSYRRESNELAVFVNTESNLWRHGEQSKSPSAFAELITNWAILDSLYFCLVNEFGYEPNRALLYRTNWLMRVYAERLEVEA